MRLTEEEKKQILSKYNEENTSNKLLNHLKREYPIYTADYEGLTPWKMIIIQGKSKILSQSKKQITNKIYSIEKENYPELEEEIIRRTIKKYLDGNLIS